MKVEAYQALDGSLFLSEADCLAHNLKDPKKALVGLTEDQVAAMLDRTDVARADALEAAARIVTKKRLDAGERRRAPKGSIVTQDTAAPRPSPMEQAA